ncbi:MAG: hypothetical protein WC499_04310 [Patescibacteria group bacterium]
MANVEFSGDFQKASLEQINSVKKASLINALGKEEVEDTIDEMKKFFELNKKEIINAQRKN